MIATSNILRYSIVVISTFILVGIVGCSSSYVPLSGKVTFDDGQVLTKGTVCFESETAFARGDLREDGTYVLGSQKNEDGLAPGIYRVYITGANETNGVDDQGMPIDKPMIAPKYSSVTESGLTCTVDKATRQFDITVERP